jgi:8-oxo-dGTP pyrophosphatase MutT (NUDIX family)
MDLVSKKEVYKNGNIVLTEKVLVSDGKEVTRVSLSLGKNTVLIIPIDKDGNFYLGQQKRGDSKEFMIEFPNGGIEKGEEVLDAAKRELSEELGLEGDMKYL